MPSRAATRHFSTPASRDREVDISDTRPALTEKDIVDIAHDTDLPLSQEAYLIAQAYHDLCTQVAGRWGDLDLNWCGFGKWSSKAVGFSLRLDNKSRFWTRVYRAFSVPRMFGRVFRGVVRFLLGGAYSKGLTIANRSIFLEIGTFHTSLLRDTTGVRIMYADPSFLWSKDLPPLVAEVPPDDLRTAARLLREAEHASPERRRDLMLGANIALSAYEQARVQPALELVFYRPVRWITRVSWRLPYYLITRASFNQYAIYTEPHDSQPALVRWLESRFLGVFSRMLILDIPLKQIFLGKKLTVPRGHQAALLNAQFIPEVKALVERFHPSDGRERLSGVANWLDYTERMRFIVSYFMIYQHGEPTMFNPPFRKPLELHPPRELLPPTPPSGLRRIRVPLVVKKALKVKDPGLTALRKARIEAKPLTLIEAGD